MNSLTDPNGIFICQSRMVQPRPQSKTNFSDPASTRVLGPNRSGSGFGVDVPSSVTLNSAVGSGPCDDTCAITAATPVNVRPIANNNLTPQTESADLPMRSFLRIG